jgi:hypothetical protein
MTIEKITDLYWENIELNKLGWKECLCMTCASTKICSLTKKLNEISKEYNMDMIITQCGVKDESGTLLYTSKEEEIGKAIKDLEIACEMIGWDETEFDSLIHTRNFIKALKKVESSGKNYGLENLISKMKKAKIEKVSENIFKSIGRYIEGIIERKSVYLNENKKEAINLNYLHNIRSRIFNLYGISVREN